MQSELCFYAKLHYNEGYQAATSEARQNDSEETYMHEEDLETRLDLRRRIFHLENENKKLIRSLELLDADFQENNAKLVSIKNKLQLGFNELQEKYVTLNQAYDASVEREKVTSNKLGDIEFKYNELNLKHSSMGKIDRDVTCNITEELSVTKQIIAPRKDVTLEGEGLAETPGIINIGEDHLSIECDVKDTDNDSNEPLHSGIADGSCKLISVDSDNSVFQNESRVTKQIEPATANSPINTIKEPSKSDNSNHTIGRKQSLFPSGVLQKGTKKLYYSEKEVLHKHYINILTDNIKKYIDCDKASDFEHTLNDSNPQISEFNNQVEDIFKILLDLKCKCKSLEKDLYIVTQEKTDLLNEKNHEIEKLLKNSEILSNEVITKTQTIKEYEIECNDLIKNNDLLIGELENYKNKSGLQTISESNEDNILLLETQLENANKHIQELEIALESNSEILKKEAYDTIDEFNIDHREDLITSLKDLKAENATLKENINKLIEEQEVDSSDKERLIAAYDKVKAELENSEYQFAEINFNMETLKEGLKEQKCSVEELITKNHTLEALNEGYEMNNEHFKSEIGVIRDKLVFEEETRNHLENQIRLLTEKLQHSKMNETSLKLQYDTMSKDLSSLIENKRNLESKIDQNNLTIQNYVDKLACTTDLLAQQNEELISALETVKSNMPDCQVDKASSENEMLENGNDTKQEVQITDANGFSSVSHGDSSSTDGLGDFLNIFTETDELGTDNKANHVKAYFNTLTQERNVLRSQLSKSLLQNQELLEEMHELKEGIKRINNSKSELTQVVVTKHQESIAYHNEIHRLSQLLNIEIERSRNLSAELESTKISNAEYVTLQHNQQMVKLVDENAFLKDKCQVLTQHLLVEKNKLHDKPPEKLSTPEKDTLTKKLERLQEHLIEVEEHYTQELLRAEQNNSQLQAKINKIEQRERNSNTMYTSVNIRANQYVETLQNQLQLITNQRDDLRKKLSDTEDQLSKQAVGLANLQFVLEQFQKDKEKDVKEETERIRRQISIERKNQDDLRNEISNLKSQLEHSKKGLQAASRLSTQLENANQLVLNLRAEVSQLKEDLHKRDEEIKNGASKTDGKVEKSLIKNLIIGFITTNRNINKDQLQILKIIATVLDFNQQDHNKISSHTTQPGMSFNVQISQATTQESLSQAFVKFLENESKPRVVPSLLNSSVSESSSNSSPVPERSGQSPNLSEVLLPTFSEFGQNRNSSSILKDVLKENN